MKNIRSISLKFWLPFTFVTVFTLLLGFLFWINFYNQRDDVVLQSERFIRQDIAALIREMEHDFTLQNQMEAKNALLTRGVNKNYNALIATDENGKVIYSTRNSQVGYLANIPLTNFNLNDFEKIQSSKAFHIVFDEEKQLLLLYAPLKLLRKINEIRSLRTGSIYLEYSLRHDFSKLLNTALERSAIMGLLMAGLLFLLAVFLYRFIRLPTEHLLEMTEKLSIDEMSSRCDIKGDGEFAKLGQAFNKMAGELVARFNSRQQAKDEALQKKFILDGVFNSIPDLFFLMDRDFVILDFRTGNKKSLYVEPEKFLGKKMQEVIPESIAKLFSNASESLFVENNITTFEYELDVAEGRRQFEARLSLLENSDKIIAVIRDITERKKSEEKILYQAHFDALTELPNRFLMLDRLSRMIFEARRVKQLVAVLFLDLDDFKIINDSLGHETGDKLLIKTANRLQKSIRSEDTVSRLGGDEFIILLGSMNSFEDINPVAENILRCFMRPFKIDGRELNISSSIGIAAFPMDGENASDLLRNADSAMYHAKALGRNCYSFFTDSMNQKVSRRLAIEEQLHGALERGEFEVFYQPQYEIKTNRLIGAEALLRWHNPALDNVSPVEFIPIAEQTGAITQLGEFVLRDATEMARQWGSHVNQSFRIAINLSPRQFRNFDIIETIKTAIEESGIAPNQLELEITEGVLLSANEYVGEILEEIHKLGICIAMDDFGTGYSSLNYLRKYPFDIVKIDRAFVNDMALSEDGNELIKAMVGMSHGLKMQVIAEGIETCEQYEMLKEIGCDIGQGYLMGRPMPKIEFDKLKQNRIFSYAV